MRTAPRSVLLVTIVALSAAIPALPAQGPATPVQAAATPTRGLESLYDATRILHETPEIEQALAVEPRLAPVLDFLGEDLLAARVDGDRVAAEQLERAVGVDALAGGGRPGGSAGAAHAPHRQDADHHERRAERLAEALASSDLDYELRLEWSAGGSAPLAAVAAERPNTSV